MAGNEDAPAGAGCRFDTPFDSPANTLVEAFEDEIRKHGHRFEGPLNVHVTLQYPEGVTLSETFPGRFGGVIRGSNRVEIDRVK
ncbi:hypothetical protein [Bradyrhizobium glycinis]|uniref:hypothetical protein n=1 Tax=Bradyrhizobium glycinis TaxID=2751812 RepID=UPI0018D7CCAD|nr:hypothetical protein [Bradyrhizobium glycinis]MBH5371553.1 hypothetical protein [Bradyrhizobium glycinis]